MTCPSGCTANYLKMEARGSKFSRVSAKGWNMEGGVYILKVRLGSENPNIKHGVFEGKVGDRKTRTSINRATRRRMVCASSRMMMIQIQIQMQIRLWKQVATLTSTAPQGELTLRKTPRLTASVTETTRQGRTASLTPAHQR